MKLRLGRLAAADAEDAVLYYRPVAGADIALRFAEALEASLRHILSYPASGSPRFAIETGIEGVRAWPVKGFPYFVFYARNGDYCKVWRILGASIDIPPRLLAAKDMPE